MHRAPRTALLASLTLLSAAGAASAPANAAVNRTTLSTGMNVAGATQNVPSADGAPDGSAAVAWLEQDGGASSHLFFSRLENGAWTSKVRVDVGMTDAPVSYALGIGAGGRLTIAFASGAAGLERLYVASSTGNGVAIGAPTDIAPTITGWKSLALDVGTTGDGYLTAHHQTKLEAFRIAAGAPPAIVAGAAGGTLNAATTGDASGNAPKQAAVGVDPTGTTAFVAWSEQDGGGADHAFARRITGTAPGQTGAAVPAEIPSLQGALASTNGNDEFSVAVGAGGKAWVGFRENFTYGALTKARSLVRAFDGTTFGTAQVIDAQPLAPADAVSDGAENPLIAVDGAGHGVAVSSGQLDNLSHVAKLTGDVWSRGTIVANTGVTPRVAMSNAGTGLTLLTTNGAGPTPNQLTARITGGPADGTTELVNDAAAGPVFNTTGTAAAADTGVVLYRQGQATDAKMIVGTFPLPPTPASPTPSPTPAPGSGPSVITPVVMARVSKLRLSSPRIARANTKPRVLSPTAKGPFLEFTLNRAARVTLLAQRPTVGRKSKSGVCAKTTKSNAKSKRCTRYVGTGGQVTFDRPAGTTRLRFTGRLGGKKALPKGRYRLVLTAAAVGSSEATVPYYLNVTLR